MTCRGNHSMAVTAAAMGRWPCVARLGPWCLRLLLALLLPAAAAGQDFVFERDVRVPMRDGTGLAANIFRPKVVGRYPVILLRSPYGKPDQTSGDAKRYVAAGYVMVVQDCRGKGASEGVWDPFAYDAEDGFDTQEWIGRQPWCNGEIGTAGGSYVGWTQWASAAGASRFLKAMVPVVPFADVYDDIAYPGGAMQLALLMGWGTGVGGVALKPEQMASAFRYLPLRSFGDQFEKRVGYLNEWARHPQPDAYWQRRRVQGSLSEVTVPTLNVGGWYDIFSKATVELVDRVRATSTDRRGRRNHCVVMGPWAHGVGGTKVGELDFGPEAKWSVGDRQFEWFEYWLKGRETGVDDWAPYQIFVMGENRWRSEHEWPLRRTRYTPYYLRSSGRSNSRGGDGVLSETAPGQETPDRYAYDGDDPVPTIGGNNLVGATAGPYDQSVVEARPDVLVYTTAPLTNAVEVTGPVRMILYAASSARDTDFTAKLVDVHPDGKAYNLCDGIIRARYRLGREQERLLEPGNVERYEIDLWVTSNVFLPGHRVRLQVSSSSFPRFDRNPNSGAPFGSDTQLLTAEQTVYHETARASHVLLPIIPR